MNKAKILKIFKISSWILSIYIVFVICMLGSSKGQNWLMSFGINWLNQNTAYNLSLQGFSGNLLRRFQFDTIKLKQHNEILLEAESLKVEWTPAALFRKQFHINEMATRMLNIQMPTKTSTASIQESSHTSVEKNKQNDKSIINLLPPVIIDKLYLPISLYNESFIIDSVVNLPQQRVNLNVFHNDLRLATLNSLYVEEAITLRFNINDQGHGLLAKIIKNAQIEFTDSVLDGVLTIKGTPSLPIVNGSISLKTQANILQKPEFELLLKTQLRSDNTNLSSDNSVLINQQQAMQANIGYSFLDKTLAAQGQSDIKIFNVILEPTKQLKSGNANFELTNANFPNTLAPLGKLKIDNVLFSDQATGVEISQGQALIELNNLDSINFKYLKADVNQGKFSGNGIFSQQNLDFGFNIHNSKIDHLLSKYPQFKEAILDVVAKIKGPLNKPNISIKSSLQNIKIADLNNDQSINVAANIFTENDLILIDANIKQRDKSISKIEMNMPYPSLGLELVNNLNVGSNISCNLEVLSKLFSKPGLHYQGMLKADLNLTGQVSSPNLAGDIVLTKGTLQHKFYGVDWRNISLKATAKGQDILVNELLVHDLDTGQIITTGQFSLNPPYLAELQTNINKFKILNSKQYNGFANGQIKVQGSVLDPDINGAIKFNKVVIILPDLPQQGPATINVISKEDFSKQSDSNFPSAANKGQIDVKVAFPQRVFIRGKGLDSELGGNLHISGKTKQPVIVGSLSIKRGTYKFLNKMFTIKKGKVNLREHEVVLDFVAQTKVDDIIVNINIQGTPDNIKISFSSNPSIPQDEILARVLFGKSITKLSPLQAVQLASVVRTLTSGGSGNDLGLMNTTKSLLKVDEFEINGNSPDSISVGAGKYITDKIYVKGQQGASLDSTKVSVDIKVTDNISIESSTGSTSQNNDIKIFWQKRY